MPDQGEVALETRVCDGDVLLEDVDGHDEEAVRRGRGRSLVVGVFNLAEDDLELTVGPGKNSTGISVEMKKVLPPRYDVA